MSEHPKISVIICTLDRAQMLCRTIASLEAQSLSPGLFEIVVVDNGSSDDTRSVVETCQACCRVPLRYVLETTQGLSLARNRGIEAAGGEILAFIDDDACAAPDWLSSLVDVIERSKGVCAAGGPVLAANLMALPEWLPKRLTPYLCVVNYGDEERRLAYPRFPFGTSMAFKREVFDKIGGFSAQFGRMGKSSFRTGEETELFLRLAKRGGWIAYTPKAVAYHTIDLNRLNRRWFFRQAFWIGASFAGMDLKNDLVLAVTLRTMFAVMLPILGGVACIAAVTCPGGQLPVYCSCVLMDNLGYLCCLIKSLTRRHFSGVKGQGRTGCPS